MRRNTGYGEGRGRDAQEIPADHEAQGIIDKLASETNEASADRIRGRHLSDTVVDHCKNKRLKSIGNEQTTGTAMVKAASNRDEEGGTDRATDGNELDLTIVQVTLEIVRIVSEHAAFLDIVDGVRGGGERVDDTATFLVFVFGREETHVDDGQGSVEGEDRGRES